MRTSPSAMIAPSRHSLSSAFTAVLLLAGIAASSQAASAEKPPRIETRATTVTVLSFNLWHDKGDWPRRRAMIVAEIARLKPDVIALQEVLQREGLRNQAEDLAAALGYRAQFVSVDPPAAARRYGNAILTRKRAETRQMRKLEPLDDYRTAVHARLRPGSPGTRIDVYATHLHNDRTGGAVRARQVSSLLNFIDATAQGAYVIVAGDFNSEADSPELQTLAARYRDAYGAAHPEASGDIAAHTTLNPAYLPAQRIDHVFYDPVGFELVDARIVLNRSRDGIWPSDHFGLLVTLRTRPRIVGLRASPN
ncbi:endonuclease/exonuclease/phosphatase family protein [Lysobacter sp. 1R34A]|uniref:endonuclease/exonuclease/phosphatase family protein n=1 Tax=Lysobacter sp. 1R34A TaxID=3445786 RepID=UPI003EE9555A